MGPEVAVPLGFFASAAFIVQSVLRYRQRRMELEQERGGAGLLPSAARLERMEQAIEAMAVEIERISEGQRFTTKLLTEQNESLRLAARSRS